ncbi:Rv3235 family protein [Streptomyces uncialis]|uniref:Rv3235 family protein n=1 Tax=Streptomyces uncialis TaxID=1048205 RepID=UPI0022528F87|nr:Rv3235 family protein [Streptomyces uncialis]MCX4664190.1 Rv3235 family protein [Streptomyces uncialis]
MHKVMTRAATRTAADGTAGTGTGGSGAGGGADGSVAGGGADAGTGGGADGRTGGGASRGTGGGAGGGTRDGAPRDPGPGSGGGHSRVPGQDVGAPHRPAGRSAASRPPARRDPRRPGGPPRGAVPRQGGARGPAGHPAPGHLAGGPRTPPGAARRPAAPDSGPPRPTDLFADRLLAVLTGRRPVHSMLRHTAGSAYDELARLAEHGPLRTRGPAPVVRDVGYCVPRNGAVEVFARIATGDRLSAMAFRLERGQDLRWRCTAIDLGPGT